MPRTSWETSQNKEKNIMVIQIDIYAIVAIALAGLFVGFVLGTWMAHSGSNRYHY